MSQVQASPPPPQPLVRPDAPSGPPSDAGRRLRRRRRALVLAAIGAALVSGGGLVGSTFVQSPAQAAADTEAPAASLITAPVTSRVLQSTVVLRGTFSDGRTVSATPTAVAATADNPGGGSSVVTEVFARRGEQVKAAVPLLEYSGRPVFALPGSLPAYRDLMPGMTGRDVTQLRAALESLGHDCGPDAPGVFGTGTKRAVSRLYAAMGYPVPVTGAATAAAVKAARQAVDQARAALKGAEAPPVPATPPGAPPGAAPGGSPAPAAAPTGPATGRAAGPDLGGLRRQLADAQQELAKAEAADGPMLPASEVVYLPSLPGRVVALPLAAGDPVKGPVVTLARDDMQLSGMLDPAQAGLVGAGVAVRITAEAQGLQATGTVESVGTLVVPGGPDPAAAGRTDAPPTAQANGGAPYLPLAIRPDQPWEAGWAGQNVRITITSAKTSEPVLAVPEAAIFAGADTRTNVTVLSPGDGGQRVVNVQAGPSADGLVQVTPVDGGRLAEGDRVVIGQ
ncbi:peptidoglycan-binding protein [Kitasatospora sp. NPDC096147]|uniref:peptidoglycan-binding protein n=1 Tax=Kitasatospora sp. NPDC096147 TaxID=3364093 RepID=UPI0038222629